MSLRLLSDRICNYSLLAIVVVEVAKFCLSCRRPTILDGIFLSSSRRAEAHSVQPHLQPQ